MLEMIYDVEANEKSEAHFQLFITKKPKVPNLLLISSVIYLRFRVSPMLRATREAPKVLRNFPRIYDYITRDEVGILVISTAIPGASSTTKSYIVNTHEINITSKDEL